MKKAKAYFMRLRIINNQIDWNIIKLENMRDSMFSNAGMDYSKDRVQTSPEERMSNMIAEYVDLNNYVNHLIDKYITTKLDIVRKIRGMDNTTYKRILFKRYVEFKPISEITNNMNHSRRWVFQKQTDALQAFEKQYLA